jgi:hypothetical protein
MSEDKKHQHQHHHGHAAPASQTEAAHEEPTPTPRRAASGGATVKVANLHRASIGLPPIHEPVKEGEPLKIKHGEQILQPGDNAVSSEHWAAAKEAPMIKNLLESGLLREGEMPKEEEGTSTARESLDGVSEERALTLASNSSDRDQLMKWQQTEKRAAVRDLINRRFEAIGQGK